MRVNVYAEEMTDRIEIIAKAIDGHNFTGLRFYLELPATVNGENVRGPFIHRPGDDDSGAVTFWGKKDMRAMLRRSLELLDAHYSDCPFVAGPNEFGVDQAGPTHAQLDRIEAVQNQILEEVKKMSETQAQLDTEIGAVATALTGLQAALTAALADLQAKAAGSSIDFTPEFTQLQTIANALSTLTSTATAADPGAPAAASETPAPVASETTTS